MIKFEMKVVPKVAAILKKFVQYKHGSRENHVGIAHTRAVVTALVCAIPARL